MKKSVSDEELSIGIMAPTGLYSYMQKYLYWMEVRNYSDMTVNRYTHNLTIFIRWCDIRGLTTPTEITKPIAERYQRYLFHYRKKDGEPIRVQTQIVRLASVRSWFKWMSKENYILYNPLADIQMPKAEHRLPAVVLSEKEVEEILRQPDITTPLGIRDRAILETLYSTGMRRLEITNLGIYDLIADKGIIVIRQGKGKRDRVVPVGDRAIKWLEKYKNEVRPELACNLDNNEMFLSKMGEKLGLHRMSYIGSGYVNKADIGKKGGCHLFRHAMATHMLDNGADIRLIQAILGHVKLETTEVYTRVSIKKLKEVHTLTHPAKAHRTKSTEIEEPELTEEDIINELEKEAQEELD